MLRRDFGGLTDFFLVTMLRRLYLVLQTTGGPAQIGSAHRAPVLPATHLHKISCDMSPSQPRRLSA